MDKSNYDFDKSPFSFRTRNFQAFEMNVYDGLTDREEIKRQIAKIISGFDFIIVVERFFESMILLAAYLNAPVETFITPRVSIRPK